MLGIAVISTLLLATTRHERSAGTEMWLFARMHYRMYQPIVTEWSRQHQLAQSVRMQLLSNDALVRRMNSGFMSDTPIADLIEVERNMAGQTFAGPTNDIGWTDLTELVKREGLDHQINSPSFSPWTWRGRVFGLPHDVHPVLLAYRSDLVESAGIDVSRIETWDDFARVMKPLQADADGDGEPDRFLLNLWYTSGDQIEALLLQAGGGLFDSSGRLSMDSDSNARVISTVVSWCTGPGRISADAPEFSAGGNQLRIQGYVVCSLVPDWLTGTWKTDMPQLAGKVKLMPLPAWKPGERRTSVWGGTMLGIPRRTSDFDSAWALAKHLYLSDTLAEELYRTNGIVSPVKRLWSHPMYDQPDTFFCGQAPGRLFLKQAPDVPLRVSSPFQGLAKARFLDAIIALRQYAIAHRVFTPDELIPEAHRLLTKAGAVVQTQMDRNVFVREEQQ